MTNADNAQAVARIRSLLGLDDIATATGVSDAVGALVAAVHELRTKVYPAIVDDTLAGHGLRLP